jgi:ligand-binding SRPBCC domain-containing protein
MMCIMPSFEIVTLIRAPQERVFDLARSVEAHAQSQAKHHEKVVGGRMTGLLELGESVTWEAVHFGVRQRLTSRIVSMTRPEHFRDSMISGAFARFDHDHFFETREGKTIMRDVFDYSAPLGVLGAIASVCVLNRYMYELINERAACLQRILEAEARP